MVLQRRVCLKFTKENLDNMQGLPSYSNHIFVITSQDMLPRFYIFTEGAQIMF